jgi:hypothetical protein
MFSDKPFTKLSLEHILYPIRGSTFQQENRDSNQPSNGVNNFQYFEYIKKDDLFYRNKVPLEIAPPEPSLNGYSVKVINNKGTSAQDTFWPLQRNTTGLLHIFNTFHYFSD